ncbi:MAG: cytochrome c biogenesis protein ResB [Chromatiales bacterium]|nr:cytochrome c biogenesis protein ResB [Chromatiales bacterium]
MRKLASTRLTIFGMILLGVGAALNYDNPVTTPAWVLAIPLLLLALNLCAAIISNPNINRRGGLLVFHIGLLLIVVLVAIGRLTKLEAKIELVEGQSFAPEDMIEVREGIWHTGDFKGIDFVQGPYSVEYTTGMTRGPTHSYIAVPDGKGGWEERVIGDHTPFVVEGYRFYTTFNKGFAAILTWTPDGGAPVTGAVHMPSYPLFEHRQANRWVLENGEEIRFWMQLETGMNPEADWKLEPARAHSRLIVRAGEERIELAPGESARLEHGTLRYERLAGWMGYKVFYDPTLRWLFIVAFLTVFGLATHFWRKFGAAEVHAAVQDARRSQIVDGGQTS